MGRSPGPPRSVQPREGWHQQQQRSHLSRPRTGFFRHRYALPPVPRLIQIHRLGPRFRTPSGAKPGAAASSPKYSAPLPGTREPAPGWGADWGASSRLGSGLGSQLPVGSAAPRFWAHSRVRSPVGSWLPTPGSWLPDPAGPRSPPGSWLPNRGADPGVSPKPGAGSQVPGGGEPAPGRAGATSRPGSALPGPGPWPRNYLPDWHVLRQPDLLPAAT